jgi:GNAT superfamily N-acetyltransferase
MNHGWQRFRAIWLYQGLWHAILRACRKFLKPVLDWDVLYVFERRLADSPTEYTVPEGISISWFKGDHDLLKAQSAIGSFCQDVETRLCRGDVAVVACTGDEVAGYTWVAFSNVWVDELEMMAIVGKGEMVHYDSFVRPMWRGHALHTCLILAAKHHARLEGCDLALSWISANNAPSLKTAQRLSKKSFKKPMVILSIKMRGISSRRNYAIRGSLSGRFLHADPPLRSMSLKNP